MRVAVDIYEKYHIPPWQQEHQLRVAAIGKSISTRLDGKAEEQTVILAGLFHDMGNILKTDFSLGNPLRALIGEENMAHWQKVKDNFAAKYGAKEHDATNTVAKDIGLSESVQTIIHDMGFSKLPEILRSESIELQIVEYADQRVGPYGVVSLDERFAEGQIRYKGRYGELGPADIERRDRSITAAHEMEHRICGWAGIRPEDITDASIAPIIEELRRYEVA